MIKKVLSITMFLFLMFVSIPTPVMAMETQQDGITVTFETDKDSYNYYENISMKLTVTNENEVNVNNIKLEMLIPDGYKLIDSSSAVKDIDLLKPGETVELEIEVIIDQKTTIHYDNINNNQNANVGTGISMDILIPILLIFISSIVLMIIIRNKKGKRIISIILSIALVGSMITVFKTDVNAKAKRKEIYIIETIKVNDQKKTLKSVVSYDQPTRVNEGEESYFNVRFVLFIEDFVDNADMFVTQKVKSGTVLVEPEIPVCSIANFVGWYTRDGDEMLFDFSTPILRDTVIYAKWDVDTTDTDHDGVYDVLENIYNTDSNKSDSDDDGLSDYDELYIGTDPLKKDTDNNGVNDIDEDADNDGLANGEEIKMKLDPTVDDTDRDGLTDYEEVYIYKTSPVKKDTDDDGASDSWEVQNEYQPLISDALFEVKETSENVTKYNPVSASVIIDLPGECIETLNITPIDSTDNSLISTTIPGYLGSAYDFSVDYEFDEATLAFNYNIEKYGIISNEFQPRIYYVNEETQIFEEVENQIVENGKVSANITHFSTYVLLNKVEFDEAWTKDIKPPEYTGDDQKEGLDVVLAIDSSGSMSSNDRSDLRKTAAKMFVNKLGKRDRASIVDFDSYATVLTSLTSDQVQLNKAIDQINNSGGTNLSNPISRGIDLLIKDDDSKNKYKYIILLTDGQGSYDKIYSQRAKDNDVQIYTIGLGSGVSTNLLQDIANDTGGKYFFASKAEELLGIYEDTASETIDYVTDSNNDGISDYYTQLIYDGELILGNGSTSFKGFNLNYDKDGNSSDDYDGDGLKNGEELKVEKKGDKIYLYMYSNPLLEHSDSDGKSDFMEVSIGSSPLKYDISKHDTSFLLNNDHYYYTSAVEQYEKDWFFQFDTEFLSYIFVWNKEELYRDIYIDYFDKYTKEDYVDDIEYEETLHLFADGIDQIIGLLNNISDSDGAKDVKLLNDSLQLLNDINSKKINLKSITYSFNDLLKKVEKIIPGQSITLKTKQINKTVKNITKYSDKVDDFFKGVTYVGYITDITDTMTSFAKINANNEAFNQNADILNRIYNMSSNSHAANSAYDILDYMTKGLVSTVDDIVRDATEITIDVLLDIASSNIYVKITLFARDFIDVITGISKDLKEQFEMMAYYELSDASISLVQEIVTANDSYFEVLETNKSDFIRYMVHIAQVRVLGENKYCEWQKDTGIMGWLFDNSEIEKNIQKQIKTILDVVNVLELKLGDKILEQFN